MRRQVILAAALLTALAGCGRNQNPSLGNEKASGPPKTELEVVAKDVAFSPKTLTAAAGKRLTITFRNEDAGVSHSFHLEGGTAGEIKTDPKAGPTSEDLHVTLNVPASYAFQCDVHPSQMKGTIVVVKAAKSDSSGY
jgi:plastocyanin